LGLDAPQKLDVSGIYQRGGDDLSAEQRAREAVIEALPIEEQRRIYARRRVPPFPRDREASARAFPSRRPRLCR
jgi:hypothetical protein